MKGKLHPFNHIHIVEDLCVITEEIPQEERSVGDTTWD
jgi:hypothetical protein